MFLASGFLISDPVMCERGLNLLILNARSWLLHDHLGVSGKSRKDSPWMRRMTCQSAWAAVITKNCYLSAQFKRLAAR
jgi:hypothetical protein